MFLLRPAIPQDAGPLFNLAQSLPLQGFLTLPSEKEALERLIDDSLCSFAGRILSPDLGRYLFVLEDGGLGRAVGCSLVLARHGTPERPHVYLRIDPIRKTLLLRWDTEGRTELGALILEPKYRGHAEKLGKRLSWIRLHYIAAHPKKFLDRILVELLPPFLPDGRSLFWESLGRRLTGREYREADLLSRRDSDFLLKNFPKGLIPIDSLTREAVKVAGVPGEATQPVVKILTEAGFRFLQEIDPLDGGPHYGAAQDEIRRDIISDFLFNSTEVKIRSFNDK